MLQCVAVCYIVLQFVVREQLVIIKQDFCIAVHKECVFSVLQCVAVRCSVLQCVQCVPVRCSVLQCVAVSCSVLQCVAVCCSVLQCVAVCCGVLQCVIVCRSVMQKENVSTAISLIIVT